MVDNNPNISAYNVKSDLTKGVEKKETAAEDKEINALFEVDKTENEDFIEFMEDKLKEAEVEKLKEKILKIFNTGETQTEKTVEDYMKEFPIIGNPLSGVHVAPPQTDEYKEHNKYMAEKSEEYNKLHPAPPHKAPEHVGPCTLSITAGSEDPEYVKWQREKQEYMENLEKTYTAEHPEYAKQKEAYERQKANAATML